MKYVLKQYYNNKYTINDLEVSSKLFDEFVPPKYKQVSYTCYFDEDNNFIRQWTMKEV